MEGTVKLWKSGGSLKLFIPRNLFLVLAGLSKRDARRLGFKGYMAATGDGCLRVAVSRTPPEWAQYAASIDVLGLLHVPRKMVESMGLTPGERRIVIEDSGGEVHAILCP